mgnify:CR=1 FL=1
MESKISKRVARDGDGNRPDVRARDAERSARGERVRQANAGRGLGIPRRAGTAGKKRTQGGGDG